MRSPRFRMLVGYAVVVIWALYCVAMVVWLVVFGITQLKKIEALQSGISGELARYHTMLMWEGGFFLLFIVAGGSALAYLLFREMKLSRQIQLFFITFAHELKTPLASLRLQAESLKEDLQGSPQCELVDRLVSDTQRLAMQLDNSLFFTSINSPALYYEDFELSEILNNLRHEWAEINVSLDRQCLVHADRRVFEAVLRNLMQNSIKHGQATQVMLRIQDLKADWLRISFRDDGRGFSGDRKRLSRAFYRPATGSGNGLGLYLVRKLISKMGGGFKVVPAESGFEVELVLRGKLI